MLKPMEGPNKVVWGWWATLVAGRQEDSGWLYGHLSMAVTADGADAQG